MDEGDFRYRGRHEKSYFALTVFVEALTLALDIAPEADQYSQGAVRRGSSSEGVEKSSERVKDLSANISQYR